MQLIDGYNGGVAHISASMIRDHNLAMYGTGDCVLDVGNKFSYEVVNNNTIRINDGMAIIGGARAIVEYGQQETMVIENGISGYKRNDLIIIEYNKDTETLKETAVMKVVKGTLGSTGVDPALATGDIRSGATQRQMPLYRVRINGLSIEGVDKLWTGATTPISGGGTGVTTVADAQEAFGISKLMNVIQTVTSPKTLTNSYSKCSLTQKLNNGDLFTFSNNEITCNAAGIVEVHMTAYCYNGFTADDGVALAVYNNGSLAARVMHRVNIAGAYEFFCRTVCLQVAEGDVLSLYAHNIAGSRGTLGDETGLEVKYIA